MNRVNTGLYEKRKTTPMNILFNILIVASVIIIVFELTFGSFYTGIYIVHGSMSPTLIGAESKDSSGGDYVYILKGKKPDYGDIIVLDRGGDNIIKRAIAFGGDTVKIERGKLYIKYSGSEYFVPIEEDYAVYNDPDKRWNNFESHTVAKNGIFLLGDNRNESSDSRQNGDYPIKNVLGVVADWSINIKGFSSAVHNFFAFTLYGKG